MTKIGQDGQPVVIYDAVLPEPVVPPARSREDVLEPSKKQRAHEVPELMKTTKPKTLREGAERVAAMLRAAGFEAYFAGGCVRDHLLGVEPKDFDVITDARPDEVTRLFKRTVQVGASFGVVKVLFGKGFEYEVATYRKDGLYTDGRRPDEVVYSDSVEEDVRRRDFTINALLEDPKTGEIIDHVGGREDLEAKLIRAVGDPKRRVAEDRLRMLRAIRFAARFGFDVEPATMAAIHEHAAEITEVSAERTTQELEGIWSCARPGLGLRLLEESGLLPHVLPFVDPDRVPQLAEQLDRIPLLGRDAARARHLAWALLFDGQDRRAIDARMREMKMSREQMRAVQTLVEASPLLVDPAKAPVAELRRLLVSREADLYADFQRALLGAGPGVDRLEEVRRELEAEPLPPLDLVTGQDLRALGLPPGPQYKEILGRIRQAILERRVKTKEQAIALVEQ